MMLPKYWVSLAFIGWALSSPCFANAPTLRPLIEKTLETHSDILAIQAQKNAFLKLADQSQIGSNPEIEFGVGQKRDRFLA